MILQILHFHLQWKRGRRWVADFFFDPQNSRLETKTPIRSESKIDQTIEKRNTEKAPLEIFILNLSIAKEIHYQLTRTFCRLHECSLSYEFVKMLVSLPKVIKSFVRKEMVQLNADWPVLLVRREAGWCWRVCRDRNSRNREDELLFED